MHLRVWLLSILALGANGIRLITPDPFDSNGQMCAVPMRYNVSCPTFCVTDISKCPDSVRPASCPSGQHYCPDGSCQSGINTKEACKNTVSKCSCPYGNIKDPQLAPDTLIYPCNGSLRVDVPNYAQNNFMGDQPLMTKCEAALQQLNVPSAYFKQCAPKPVSKLTFQEPEFLVFYIFLAFEVVFLSLYEAFRRFQNYQYSKKAVRTVTRMQSSKFVVVSDETDIETNKNLEKLNTIQMTGYVPTVFGTLVKGSIIFTSFVLMLILTILIGDYYGIFSGINYRDRAMLLVDQPTLSKVFVLMWHVVTLWFIFLQINSVNLMTYFMSKIELDQANYVLVRKRIEPQSGLQGESKWVSYILTLEKYILPIRKDMVASLETVKLTPSGRRYIEFECVRYVFDAVQTQFKPYEWKIGPTNHDIHAVATGLTNNEALFRQELNGLNDIAFKGDTFWSGIKKEFTGMFYIYQLMQIIIWYYYAYYYMALVVNIVIIVSGVVKVIVSNRAQQQIIAMAKFTGRYNVYRNGKWIVLDSDQLVPGDVFEIKAQDSAIPVDCLLISGGAVMDESSVTGEALPVAKFSLKNSTENYDADDSHHLYSLYAGCKVLEVKPNDKESRVKAFVVATGASTAKGNMVRDILYPVPFQFIFTEHLKIVIFALIIWGILLLFLSMLLLDTVGTESWFYGMTSISQVLSPLLPAVMVIGQSIASERLRKKGIVTVDLNRITLAGKVKLFCFDKTGTLTKEGLDFMGVQEADDENNFAEVTTYYDSFGDIMKRIMLTCHTLTTIKDKFVGNFVDIEMFRVTSGSLVNAEGNASTSTVYPSPSSNIPPLRIIKRFEFSHKHAYMSAIVRDTATGRLNVYMKGSCEKIKELVDPDTIPADYDEAIRYHSSKGFYLIATAYCEIPAGTSQDVAMHWPREFLEKNACFIGFMMFRNEVKPDTAQALSELRRGGCRVSMITGDNINTAIYIAWASGMIKKDWQKQDPLVIIGDLKEKDVEWINTDDNSVLSPQILDTLIQRSRKGFRPVEIAITGKAFHKLTQEGWLQRNILEVRVFARMKPMDKVKCIRLHMEKGITAMCGDGGNDAGALKACHTGIALSNGDTSVVGHFSTRSTSINSCVELLKEARCSLDVSFAAYKYLMMYGEILAFVGMVQYLFKVNISQAAYILIDACTVPFSWALSMAQPNKSLVETRPTAKLLGYETILSVVGQIAIDVVFMAVAIALLVSQPFYKCHGFDNSKVDISRWWELADNYEAQVTSLMLIFQIFHAAAALNIGWRYRQGFIKNWKFVLVYTTLISVLCYIALADPNPLGCLFRVNCGTKEALLSLGYNVNFPTPTEYYSSFGHNVIPQYFRYVIICVSAINLLAVLAWEGIFIQGAGRRWALRRWQRPKNEYRY